MPPINQSYTTQAASMMPQQKSRKGLIITLVILSLLLFMGSGVLGYFLLKENKDHDKTISQLQKQTEIVNKNAQVIRDSELEPGFRPVLQQAANRECNTSSAVLFNTTTSIEKNSDGTTKKYFGVGQFICNFGNSTVNSHIRFAAAQSYDGNVWEFTYGSSTVAPTSLPSYIFDTDPSLFNRKYNNPGRF